MIILDGTAWTDSLPLIRTALAKLGNGRVGAGYADDSLEAKRLAAIAWLRKNRRGGWILDQVKEVP